MTQKPDTWMPLYLGDYLGDTQRLTTEQHGAYLLLMFDYWRNGPPPADDVVLAQITRLDRRVWKKHKAVLLGYFKERGGRLHHKRIDEELEKAAANQERRTGRARAGADARWGKRDERQGQLEIAQEPDAHSNAVSNAPSIAASTPQAMLEKGGCAPPSPSPIENPPNHPEPGPRARERDPPSALDRVFDAAGWRPPTKAKRVEAQADLDGWMDGGFDLEQDVLPGIAKAIADQPGKTGSLRRFTTTIAELRAKRQRPASKNGPAQPAAIDIGEHAPLLRDALKREVGARTHDAWFRPCSIVTSTDQVTLIAPSRFMADWIVSHNEQLLLKLVKAVFGRAVPVEVRVGADETKCAA